MLGRVLIGSLLLTVRGFGALVLTYSRWRIFPNISRGHGFQKSDISLDGDCWYIYLQWSACIMRIGMVNLIWLYMPVPDIVQIVIQIEPNCIDQMFRHKQVCFLVAPTVFSITLYGLTCRVGKGVGPFTCRSANVAFGRVFLTNSININHIGRWG